MKSLAEPKLQMFAVTTDEGTCVCESLGDLIIYLQDLLENEIEIKNIKTQKMTLTDYEKLPEIE